MLYQSNERCNSQGRGLVIFAKRHAKSHRRLRASKTSQKTRRQTARRLIVEAKTRDAAAVCHGDRPTRIVLAGDQDGIMAQ
ncbi:MAG: hypothetical protein CAPSK01_004405 [Candidatus Accumulibacter vicinus]|uniref:Uncharacterized protein n=2 Tax=Candidatus Accumulibacter vicinus TaxID=2954382 RepID=A0A084XUV0_9PROT|nr:MAG: hypothetical protein CAPSK01_004405 [Candidatus Accumulibacter vicinus]